MSVLDNAIIVLKMTMGPKRYCMGCGEPVDTHIVDRCGTKELCCLYCGLTLKIIEEDKEEDKIELAPEEDVPTVENIILEHIEDEEPEAGLIIIADDSDFLRAFMRKLILKKGLAKEVIACRDGQEFITEATKALAQDRTPELVILDLEMPRMNGVMAARTLRAVESKFEIGQKIPILFFSVRRCDEGLKKQLATCAPASYINKGVDSSPEHLTHRVDQLIKLLLKKRAEKGA